MGARGVGNAPAAHRFAGFCHNDFHNSVRLPTLNNLLTLRVLTSHPVVYP